MRHVKCSMKRIEMHDAGFMYSDFKNDLLALCNSDFKNDFIGFAITTFLTCEPMMTLCNFSYFRFYHLNNILCRFVKTCVVRWSVDVRIQRHYSRMSALLLY